MNGGASERRRENTEETNIRKRRPINTPGSTLMNNSINGSVNSNRKTCLYFILITLLNPSSAVCVDTLINKKRMMTIKTTMREIRKLKIVINQN